MKTVVSRKVAQQNPACSYLQHVVANLVRYTNIIYKVIKTYYKYGGDIDGLSRGGKSVKKLV